MELTNIHQLRASAGFVPDLPPEDLPAGTFSGGSNYTVGARGIEKTPVFSELNLVPDNNPHAIFYQQISAADSKIIVAGDSKIILFDGTSKVDVTRVSGDYSADAKTAPWSITDLNGVVFLNNAGDILQYSAVSGLLEDAPNMPAGMQFKQVVAYKNFLFGLGTSEDSGATWDNNRIVWGDPAEPGKVPPGWEIGDPATTSGDNIIPSKLGLRDGLVLGETLFLYNGDSTYAVDFTGGSFVFTFKKRFADFGILSNNCVVAYDNRHFVITEEDFRTHDGFKSDPIGTDTIRDYFFDTLDKANFARTFVTTNIIKAQIWICYPTIGNTTPNRAIIWNWKRNSWGIKDLPKNFSSGDFAERTADTIRTWNDISGTWDRVGNWSDTAFRELESQMIFLTKDNDNIVGESSDGLELGLPQKTVLERIALPLGPLSRDGVIRSDFKQVKQVGEIWFYGSTDGPFDVQLGGQDTLSEEVVWGEVVTFDPKTSRKLDYMFSAVFISMRIITEASKFSLNKIEFRFAMEGELYGFG